MNYSPYKKIGYEDIYHSGVVGMKWGVRRYQNPDGTLTEAGKIRYGNVSGMTNEELRNKTERARLESEYYRAQSNINSTISSDNKSKVKDFFEKHGDAVVAASIPALVAIGSLWLKQKWGLIPSPAKTNNEESKTKKVNKK